MHTASNLNSKTGIMDSVFNYASDITASWDIYFNSHNISYDLYTIIKKENYS